MEALLGLRERQDRAPLTAAIAARGRAEVRDMPVTPDDHALMKRLCLDFLKSDAN